MRYYLLMVGLLVVAAGCGDSRIVPVSGRVTLDKKPVVNARVNFEPLSEGIPGPGSAGKTDANGQFTLQLLPLGDRKGAFIGEYTVKIIAYEGDDGSIPSSGSDMKFRKRIIPDEYVHGKLTFKVPPGGTTEANFDLETPPAK